MPKISIEIGKFDSSIKLFKRLSKIKIEKKSKSNIIFSQKETFVQTNVGPKYCWLKEIWVRKRIFRPKFLLVKKNVGPKKFDKKNLSKIILD